MPFIVDTPADTIHYRGDPVALGVAVRDENGVPAAATTVTCTVTLPDGTTATPEVTTTATGVYVATYTPTLVGRHLVYWLATGNNACTFSDVFDVVRFAPASPLLTVADVATYLNRTIAVNDEATAEAAVAFALAQVVDVVGFDPADTDYMVTLADVSLARGVAVRIAAQAFTNPQERPSYAGPEGLSFTGSPLVVGKIMSDADRKCLVSIQCRYAPGFA